MNDAKELVLNSRRILVTGHLRSDGDSLGSAILLTRALRAMGKEVQIIMPNQPDTRYQFLYEHTPWTLYEEHGSISDFDLCIVCDCSHLDRLGEMGEELSKSSIPRIVIDHHPYDPQKHSWSAMVHDTTASATGILAFDFANSLNATVDAIAMEAGFVALMTDTGWLKYSNADARAFRFAADLVAGGVNPDHVYRLIYQQNDPGAPLGIALALSSTEYICDGLVAIGYVTPDALQKSHGLLEETDEVLDILRAVKTVEAVAFLCFRDGQVKASFRSKRWLDVNQVARKCGGGGHVRAAGATFAAGVSLQEALNEVRGHLSEAASQPPE